jgi:effector-binding domain-containing protein
MARQSEVGVKQTEPITVAYVARKGSFATIGEAMGALFGWIAQQGYTPAGPLRGTFYNAPGQVPEDELFWRICAPIAGDVAPFGPDAQGFGVKELEPHQVATIMHTGPFEEVGETYTALGGWIAENGYQIVGPSTEIWLSDPDVTPVADLLTEIQFPVAKG